MLLAESVNHAVLSPDVLQCAYQAETPFAVLLPSELWDIIIDFLHDDKRAMRRCSLVCKAWISSSRLHLFHAVSLRKRTLAKLPPFLQSNAGISSNINTLSIHRQLSLKLCLLRGILYFLPTLRILNLSHCCILPGCPPWRPCRPQATTYPYISTLTLDCCKLHAVEDMYNLLEVITLFSVIDSLHLKLDDPVLPAWVLMTWYSSTVLRSLSASFLPVSFIANLVSGLDNPTALRSLELYRCMPPRHDQDDAAQLRRLLDVIGPTLEHLAILPEPYARIVGSKTFGASRRLPLSLVVIVSCSHPAHIPRRPADRTPEALLEGGTAEARSVAMCTNLRRLDILCPELPRMVNLYRLLDSFQTDFRSAPAAVMFPPSLSTVRFVLRNIPSTSLGRRPWFERRRDRALLESLWSCMWSTVELLLWLGFPRLKFEIVAAKDAQVASEDLEAARAYLEKHLSVIIGAGRLTVFPDMHGAS